MPGHVVLALLLVFPALALLPAYFALDTGCVRLISLMWLEDVIPIHLSSSERVKGPMALQVRQLASTNEKGRIYWPSYISDIQIAEHSLPF
jgi:hypothetical protein